MTSATPHHADSSDEKVVARVLGGDTDAFRVLVERYEVAVFRLVRNLAPCASTDEDLAQEVFLTAFLALSSFDATRGRFSSWLFAIAKNRCVNACKKKTPYLMDELPVLAAPTTPADDLDLLEIHRRLDAALESLPEDQRMTFVLEEVVGLTTDQIAEIEGVSEGAIRSRLSRAKARLRDALSCDGRKGE